MASADIAIAEMLGDEGFPGYVNDPDDPGGETVAGLTRKDNPAFPGWVPVDAIKRRLGPGCAAEAINAALRALPEFRPQVVAWYTPRYWTPLHLDDQPNQRLANQVFKFAVNAGASPSLAALQAAEQAANAAFQKAGLSDA